MRHGATMTSIIFATGNQAKIDDAQKAFHKLGINVLGQKIDFQEIQTLDQEEIVRNKAWQAYHLTGKSLFVDDTGFYFDNYKQFPGTLTKFLNKTIGVTGLTKLFDEGQTGYFKTLICLKSNNQEIVVEGLLKGKLTKSISSIFNPDTPINSIFIPNGYDRPLIELTNSKEVGNFHRIDALNQLVDEITKLKELS